MSFISLIARRHLQQRPDAIATIDGDRRRTWRTVVPQLDQISDALVNAGIQAGDRVALLAPNSDMHFDLFLATMAIGAVFVPLNTRYSSPELVYAIDDCEASILFVESELLARHRDGIAGCKSPKQIVELPVDRQAELSALHRWAAGTPPIGNHGVHQDKLVVIMYTGGTTGRSKGVMLSDTSLLFSSLASINHPGNRPDRAYLHTAPLFHVGAIAATTNTLLVGGTQVYMPAFDPAEVIEIIEREQVSDVFLVPTMLHAVLNHASFDPERLKELNRINYGGSGIDDALMHQSLVALPHVAFVQSFGMTELSPVATMLGPEGHTLEARKEPWGRSAGQSTMVTHVLIVGPDGNELPRGEVGEVAVRGPQVMLGYWRQPEATAAAIRGGYMHTGDMGRMDENGFVTIVDRLKDMIITGGENVYSAEVENALCSHPGVQRAAVVGLKDERWGEAIHAVVVRAPGASVDGTILRDHCRTLLAGYKVPKTVDFVDALPLSPAGKVLKHELRSRYNDA